MCALKIRCQSINERGSNRVRGQGIIVLVSGCSGSTYFCPFVDQRAWACVCTFVYAVCVCVCICVYDFHRG